MLSLCLAAHAFNAPTVHVAQPVVRSTPVQMMADMPSRRAALLSGASLLAVPFAVQAKPEDYVGGCAFAPRLFFRCGCSTLFFMRRALPPHSHFALVPFARRHGQNVREDVLGGEG